MKTKFFTVILFLFFCFGSNAQKTNHIFLESNFAIGQPIVYSELLDADDLNKRYEYFDIKLGWNSASESPYKYFFRPTYGLILNHFTLRPKELLGRPFSISGFYNSKFLYREKFSAFWELGFGFATNFSPYDSITNPKMDLISTNLNLHAFLNLGFNYHINKQSDVFANIRFMHFSNGAMRMPNKGMNLYASGIGYRYYFNRSGITAKPDYIFQKPEKLKYNEIDVHYSVGLKVPQKPWSKDAPKYLTTTLRADFFRRYHHVGKYGFGVDLIYDKSIIKVFPDSETHELMMYGFHIGHELMLGEVALLYQGGIYLKKYVDLKQLAYMRLGVTKYFGEKLYMTISMKTLQGFKADFFEAGMGYKFIFD